MRERTDRRDVLLAVVGVALLAVGCWITYSTFRPLPPGEHVDGRGLFVEFFVVPPVTTGGLLLGAVAARRWLPPTRRRQLRPAVYVGSAIAAVSLPLAYVVFFAGPGVDHRLASYADWYVLSLGLTGLVVAAWAVRLAYSVLSK